MIDFRTIAFAQAAHEFRNPLNGMSLALELLTDSVDMKKGSKYYRVAHNCTNLMMHLVNDILDFSQMEAKKLILNISDGISISQVLNECVELLIFKAESKGLSLTFEIENGVPKTIRTDANRLKQVLINLISNAIKYTEVEGIVKVIAKLSTANQLHIDVLDNGVGIESDKLSGLFTTFNKIMKNRDLNKEGVGLGLTISKSLIE
jgi:two-component system, sensor histidine kinase and response regulator